MAKASSPSYVVNSEFARTDHSTGLDTRYAVGDPYDGADIDLYLQRGLIIPASAGQPGNSEGKSE